MKCDRCLNDCDKYDNSLVMEGVYWKSKAKVCVKCREEVKKGLGTTLAYKSAMLNFLMYDKSKVDALIEEEFSVDANLVFYKGELDA